MSAADRLDPIRRASQLLHEAEVERNRMLRSLRSQRIPLTQLSEAANVSLGEVHGLTRPSTIASVGYEGRSADELVEGSRPPVSTHWSMCGRTRSVASRGCPRPHLAERCRARSIAYLHERTLGNPRDNRDDFRAGNAVGRATYERYLNENGGDALQRVAALLRVQTVGLLCFEADHDSCHRSIVADHLIRLDPLASVRQV